MSMLPSLPNRRTVGTVAAVVVVVAAASRSVRQGAETTDEEPGQSPAEPLGLDEAERDLALP